MPRSLEAWWAISNLELLRDTAESWVLTLRSPGVLRLYIAGTTLLTFVMGFITYTVDFQPTQTFAWHLAGFLAVVSEWMNPAAVAVAVILFSITPNLMEFIGGGLAAHGNLVAGAAVTLSLGFDALTDAPAAYDIGQAFVSYFLPFLDGPLQVLFSGLVAFPVLLFNTAGAEILFFTFAVTLYLLLRQHQAVTRRQGRM
jgi:hypothetical protein